MWEAALLELNGVYNWTAPTCRRSILIRRAYFLRVHLLHSHSSSRPCVNNVDVFSEEAESALHSVCFDVVTLQLEWCGSSVVVAGEQASHYLRYDDQELDCTRESWMIPGEEFALATTAGVDETLFSFYGISWLQMMMKL